MWPLHPDDTLKPKEKHKWIAMPDLVNTPSAPQAQAAKLGACFFFLSEKAQLLIWQSQRILEESVSLFQPKRPAQI
jgi:hypothetical protein